MHGSYMVPGPEHVLRLEVLKKAHAGVIECHCNDFARSCRSVLEAGNNDVLSACTALEPVSHTKHIWYSEHGMYCQFKIILEQAMSATHVAVIPHTRTHSDKEEFLKKRLS